MRLVEDLLDMARIISGKLRLKIDAVSLAEVAQAAVDVVAPGGGRQEHRDRRGVHDDAAAGQRRHRAAAAGDLEPALERGEVHRGGRQDLCSRSRATAPNVRLRSRDTGQGIAPDFLPYVFDWFRQADASASRRHGGLGLGLALVRQIVELHGGAVGVESARRQEGRDLFWVTLPRRRI